MKKAIEMAQVISQKPLGTDIYDMTLHAPQVAREAVAGQ